MHTGPQSPHTQPQAPSKGVSGALLIGGIAFALVFLLIVAGTVGYLVLRGGGGGGREVATGTTTAAETTATETTTSAAPETVTAERCWAPEERERTSTNPSGRLRGGGLEMIPPAVFSERWEWGFPAYAQDMQVAAAHVEGTWYSTIAVGAVEWQPGIEYPGDKVAAETILDCFFRGSNWGDATGRTLDDEFTQAVTIAGMPGYRADGVVNFTDDPLELTDATGITVIVVTTPQGPSFFLTDWAVGVTEHEEAVDEAIGSLTGLSG